jgi:transposase
MMDAKQREFTLLRADGLSYDKIALKLKVTKSTLIQWSKLFQSEIEELQFHAMAQLKETYTWNLKSKYETLLKQLQKIDNAILDADVSTTQIKDLFTIKQNLIYQLESLEKKVSIKSNVVTKNVLGEKEDIPMRLNEV